jgi:hypothetical protein
MTCIAPPKHIARAIEDAPTEAQDGLWALRDLILKTAARLPEVGRVEECLKWGQPAFTTPETKSGSTLRIGAPKSGGFALYAHCQTNIISSYADAFPGLDRIDGNRAILFNDVSEIDPVRHGQLIAHGLRYHL